MSFTKNSFFVTLITYISVKYQFIKKFIDDQLIN